MMTDNQAPYISVCIPVYNGEDFMARAVESVLKQDYDRYEIIIVDDCSTDNSPELAEQFKKQSGKVRVHRNETNLGITRNWNRCVELAQGDYIVILHQDDELAEGALRKESAVLNSHPEVGIVFGNTDVVYLPKGRHVTYPGWDSSFIIKGHDFVPYMLGHLNVIYCPTVMMRKSCLEEYGVFDERYEIHEDYEMWLRLALKGVGFAFLDCILAVYNYHRTNTSKRVIQEGLNIRECGFLMDTHAQEIRDIYGDGAEGFLQKFRKTFAYLCLGYALNLIYNGHYKAARDQLRAACDLYPPYKKHHIVRTLNLLGSLKIAGRVGVVVVEEFTQRTGIRHLLEKRTYNTETEIPSPVTPFTGTNP